MSMALLVGFITAYPMNWWLVSRHMKHGMMMVRPPEESVDAGAHKRMNDTRSSSEDSGVAQKKTTHSMDSDEKKVSNSVLTWMTTLSFLVFGLGLSITIVFGGL